MLFRSSEKLDVTPSLVSLRLVPYTGEEEPTPEQEVAATVLPPRKTLQQAGVTDGAWLLAPLAVTTTGASHASSASDPHCCLPRLC